MNKERIAELKDAVRELFQYVPVTPKNIQCEADLLLLLDEKAEQIKAGATVGIPDDLTGEEAEAIAANHYGVDPPSPGLHDADERERVRSLLEDVCGDCIHEGRPLVSDEVIDSILAQPKPTVARGLSYHVWKDGVWLGEIDGDDSSELSDRIFIAHVQSHLKPGQEVVCKICNRTAKEICGITIEEEKNG